MEDVLNQKESIHMIILCKFLKALGRRMRDMIGIAYRQVGFQTYVYSCILKIMEFLIQINVDLILVFPFLFRGAYWN